MKEDYKPIYKRAIFWKVVAICLAVVCVIMGILIAGIDKGWW